METENKCSHRRTKRNYPHGRKSTPFIHCKDCGEVISPLKLRELRMNRGKKNGRKK